MPDTPTNGSRPHGLRLPAQPKVKRTPASDPASGEAWAQLPAGKPFKLPRRLRWILVLMVVCALLGVAAFAAASKPKSDVPTGPKYEGFALLVAQNYTAGHPLEVPMASGLASTLGRQSQASVDTSSTNSTDAQTITDMKVVSTTFASYSQKTSGKSTIESDVFTLEYGSGATNQLAVVVEGTSTGPELAALPSLLPAPAPPPQQSQASTGVPPGQLSTPLSQAILNQIAAWAQAYAGNQGSTLYTLTGDTTARTYVGIGGYSVVGNPVVISATQDGPRLPASLVVSIQVTMQQQSDPTVVLNTSYDLLVTNLEDHQPNVAAWGPIGSGPTLVAYQNGR